MPRKAPVTAAASRVAAMLTGAQVQNGLTVPMRSFSSARVITYADRYHASNSALETPIQYIQRAAEDENKRRASR